MEAETGRAAEAFDDLPDPIWEIGAHDLTVRTANAAARAAGIAVDDRPERLPATPQVRTDALRAVRTTLRTGRAGRGLHWRLAGVAHTVDLIRVLDEGGRVRGVLAQARVIPEPARLALVPAGDDLDRNRPDQDGPDQRGAAADGAGPGGEPAPGHHPARVPVPGAFRLAVHRVDADDTGDWFGTIALGCGRLALVVGDVPGAGSGRSGVPVVVGALRAVLTEALRAGETLAEAVRRVDAAAARFAVGHGATVSVAVLDPRSGTVEHLSRGHCPPLVCDATGAARTLTGAASGPLGVDGPTTGPVLDRLGTGSALVLCSAGLLERAGRPVTTGTDELTAAVRRSWHPTDSDAAADALCARVLDGLPAGCDGVLMAATVPAGAPRAMDARITADPRWIVDVRERLETWLRETGVPTDALAAVPIVASELVTNAVAHAYPNGVDGPIRVHAAHDGPSGLLLTVADDGGWAPPPPEPSEGGRRRGVGLAIARELSDDLDLDSGPHGTCVRARFELTRPVVVRSRPVHLQVAEPDTPRTR